MLTMLTKNNKKYFRHYSLEQSDSLRRDPLIRPTICANFKEIHINGQKLLPLILTTINPTVFTDIVVRSETNNLSRISFVYSIMPANFKQ